MSETMSVQARTESGKGVARKLRAAGRLPGTLYGQGEPAQSIQMDAAMFEAIVRTGAHHRLLDVTVDGSATVVKALVREVQIHPVSRAAVHVDLQRVSMRERIHVQVPVVLVGKPEGVRNQGGILEHNLREVEVECLPSAIPEQIEVDVNDLNVGQALHISDLSHEGVTFLGHPETTVATVSLPAAERATEEVPAAEGEVAEAPEGAEAAAKPEKAEGEGADEKGGSA